MIDPRPYTYEYRKPRPNNPTFQSSSVYDSLYHMRLPSKNQMLFTRPNEMIQERKIQVPVESARMSQYNPEMHDVRRNNFVGQVQHEQAREKQISHDQRQTKLPEIPQRGQSLQRDISQRFTNNDSHINNRFNSNQPRKVDSHLSNYGQNLMKSQTFNRFAIYEKQQKGYNIINCYPKSMASSLRVFPKLTLQNKLIQNARYRF